MKKILVPTDFSSYAFNAAKYAAELAVIKNWQVHLIHVHRTFYSGFQGEYQNEQDKALAEEMCEKNMKAVTGKLQKLYNSVRINGFCLIGILEEVMREETEKDDVALVIMGTKGATGLKYRIIGSNTYGLIKKINVPLMAVPEKYKNFNLKKVGFTTNYHSIEILALQDFIDLLGNKIKVIPFHLYKDDKETEEIKMNKWKEKASKMVTQKPAMFKLSRIRNISSGFKRFIKKEKLDVVVATKTHKSFANRLTSKSLIKMLAHQSPVPVLFINET